MTKIYLADRECKVNASEALQEIDKQYLGWGWNTEQTTLDLVDYAKDLERQLEDKTALLQAYLEALRTHPDQSQVQTIIDTNLSEYKRLLPQHSQYRSKEKGE